MAESGEKFPGKTETHKERLIAAEISPTAKLVAGLRMDSGLKYAKEIAAVCGVGDAVEQIYGERSSFKEAPLDKLMYSMMELRHRSLDEVVARKGIKNIFEIASGVAPRGLIQTEDPEVVYVESDLPGILAEKRAIVSSVLDGAVRPNLHLEAVDASNAEQMANATSIFNGPVGVIHEGMLVYLPMDDSSGIDKNHVVQNIREILQKHGGYWATPDIMTLARVSQLRNRAPGTEFREKLFRTFEKGAFEDERAAEDFMESFSFNVTRLNQLELAPNLVTPTNAEMKKWLEPEEVWVMELQ